MSRLWALLISAAAYAGPGVPPADEAVFAPMQAEMERSLSRLKQDNFAPPYFIAYRVVDQQSYEVAAAFGSAVTEGESQRRQLFVEVRYGDKTLDNTDLSFRGLSGEAGRTPQALRQNLWLLTDEAYKGALMGFLEKKAKRATELVPDVLDDFTQEPPVRRSLPQKPANLDRKKAKALVERLSAVFARYPEIYDARVTCDLGWSRRYLLTSEGTRLAVPGENVPSTLSYFLVTRAPDGMKLRAHRMWTFRELSDLPSEKELSAAAKDLAEELSAARLAPEQAPVAGPAILDPEMTGVLFHEALGHKLEGQRQRDPQQSQLFKDQVGKPVIPEFLSLIDDPTMSHFGAVPLHGHYLYDDEGVAAQRVVLVERGVLKDFLMSRWPIKGFSRSNGHGRADAKLRPTGRMANLIVQAEGAVSREELKRRLMALARREGKPYGFILGGAFGGENPNNREAAQTLEVRPRRVYRVDAVTGEQTLVRGVSLVGTPLVMLNRIVAAGDDATLANGFFCGAESGYVPVNQIAPSVLVSEVELQRLPEELARPPILASPLHDGDEAMAARQERKKKKP